MGHEGEWGNTQGGWSNPLLQVAKCMMDIKLPNLLRKLCQMKKVSF